MYKHTYIDTYIHSIIVCREAMTILIVKIA